MRRKIQFFYWIEALWSYHKSDLKTNTKRVFEYTCYITAVAQNTNHTSIIMTNMVLSLQSRYKPQTMWFLCVITLHKLVELDIDPLPLRHLIRRILLDSPLEFQSKMNNWIFLHFIGHLNYIIFLTQNVLLLGLRKTLRNLCMNYEHRFAIKTSIYSYCETTYCIGVVIQMRAGVEICAGPVVRDQ